MPNDANGKLTAEQIEEWREALTLAYRMNSGGIELASATLRLASARRQVNALCDMALASLSETPAQERETRVVYRGSHEYSDYLKHRFYDRGSSLSFEWQGRRWKYIHTDFDDRGDFDVLLAGAPLPDGNEQQSGGKR